MPNIAYDYLDGFGQFGILKYTTEDSDFGNWETVTVGAEGGIPNQDSTEIILQEYRWIRVSITIELSTVISLQEFGANRTLFITYGPDALGDDNTDDKYIYVWGTQLEEVDNIDSLPSEYRPELGGGIRITHNNQSDDG